MKLRRIAAALGAALVLAACGQTSAGVVAHVGEETIDLSSFAGRVARAYENEQFANQQPKEEYQRQLLRDLIISRLVEETARRLGVSVTDRQVQARLDEVIEGYGGRARFAEVLPASGFRMEDAAGVIRTELLQIGILDKLVADIPLTEEQLRAQYRRQLKEYDTAQIAHILVHDRKIANRVVTAARRPGADFAALARRYSQDPDTKDTGGSLGRIGNGEGRFSARFERAVFAAKAGDVVGPIPVEVESAPDITGYEIVKVVERTTRAFDEVREDVRRALLRNQQIERFNAYLGDLARELGIKVNPRFGRWDAQRLAIAPESGNELSSPAPVPGQQPAGVLPGQGQPPAGQPGQGQPPAGQPGQGQPPAGQPAATPTAP